MRTSRRHHDVELRTVQLDHGSLRHVDVAIRRNPRARHVRLHVDEHGCVTASVPARFAAHRLDRIVQERSEWIHGVVTRMQLATRATEVDLFRGDPVRLLGRWHATRLLDGRRSSCRLADDGPLEIVCAGDADPYDLLQRWYRARARELFHERVAWWAAEFRLRPGRISVRDQRTRWGSCSHRGDLSFNWRLVLAPLWVLDSIVVHELCHIDELNHSHRFWGLLDARYPRHREARAWLEQHGPALRVTRPVHGAHAASTRAGAHDAPRNTTAVPLRLFADPSQT